MTSGILWRIKNVQKGWIGGRASRQTPSAHRKATSYLMSRNIGFTEPPPSPLKTRENDASRASSINLFELFSHPLTSSIDLTCCGLCFRKFWKFIRCNFYPANWCKFELAAVLGHSHRFFRTMASETLHVLHEHRRDAWFRAGQSTAAMLIG